MKNKNRSLAYYDSMSGLIPCKVLSVNGAMCDVIVTADRGAYKRGELLRSIACYVVPRACVHVRSGQYRINPNYIWYINRNGLIDYDFIKDK